MVAVEPSTAWKAETRNFLLSEIARHNEQNKESWWQSWVDNFHLANFAWRPVGVFALVTLLVVGGSGVVTVASKNAVPGDNLFVVKRAWEKMNDYMVTDAAHKTELASAVLGTRVNDLQKVLEQESKLVSAENKTEARGSVMVAVNEVKKQIDEVTNKFATMQNEEAESGQKVAEAALALSDKIINYKEELKAAKEKVGDSETDKELNEVLDKVESINSEVLAVLVDKHSKGEWAVEEGQLASKLQDHLKEVENKVAQVGEAVKVADKTTSVLTIKIDEAKEAIKKAGEAMDKNEYSLVLTLTKDSNDILEMIYGSIYETKNDAGVVEGVGTEATSTEEVVIEIDESGDNSTSTNRGTIQTESKESEPEEPAEFPVNILK